MVFFAAATSALLHACWNLIANVQSAPRDALMGITLATATLCAAALPWVGFPNIEAWPWIIAAAACNVIYSRTVIEAYARANYSAVYAIVRAVIPPTLFLLGWLLLAEPVRIPAAAGLILVAIGLWAIAASNHVSGKLTLPGFLLSALAGLVLSFALLFDVAGIKSVGSDVASLVRYVVASSLVTAAGLIILSVIERTNPFTVLISHTKLCYFGALLLLLSYLCGMWAYAHGPIGLVAPLRESGILFASVLAVLVLREHVTTRRLVAIGITTIGVVLVQSG
jgi:drug/metabolite transporter (DMT)-like permease